MWEVLVVSVALVERADLVVSAELAAETEFQRFQPAVTGATGSTTLNIAAVPLTGIEPLPIGLAEPRAAIRSPNARATRGNNLAGRAAICRVIAREADPRQVIEPAVLGWGIDPEPAPIASVAAISHAAAVATGTHLAAVRAVTTDRVPVPAAAEDHRACGPLAEEAVAEAADSVGVAGAAVDEDNRGSFEEDQRSSG